MDCLVGRRVVSDAGAIGQPVYPALPPHVRSGRGWRVHRLLGHSVWRVGDALLQVLLGAAHDGHGELLPHQRHHLCALAAGGGGGGLGHGRDKRERLCRVNCEHREHLCRGGHQPMGRQLRGRSCGGWRRRRGRPRRCWRLRGCARGDASPPLWLACAAPRPQHVCPRRLRWRPRGTLCLARCTGDHADPTSAGRAGDSASSP